MAVLDFERPLVELEEKIKELKSFRHRSVNLNQEMAKLEKKLETLRKEIYGNLSAWQRVQLARHPKRPYTSDYIGLLMTDFFELHGDRCFGDDKAIISGFAKFEGMNVLVVGHQKGRDTKENLMRNFGCAHPEGYRKAIRLMQLAEKFHVPIVSFIDTPGAYPGIGAEERGQAEAIAFNLREMITLTVPIVCVVIGEGGSGGALGIGIGDRVGVLENAYYSVISPEGCAAILWKDRKMAPEAASVLKLTAYDLKQLGIIDEVVAEPLGGAHTNASQTAQHIRTILRTWLKQLHTLNPETLLEQRYQKYRKMGFFEEMPL